jgi:hypothetical protein
VESVGPCADVEADEIKEEGCFGQWVDELLAVWAGGSFFMGWAVLGSWT